MALLRTNLLEAQRLIQEVLDAENTYSQISPPIADDTQVEFEPGLPDLSGITTPEAEDEVDNLVAGLGDPNGLCWGNKFTKEERRFVRQMAIDFSQVVTLDPDWFMACFAFETMETFSTTIRPKRKDGTLISSAVGLIQWLNATAKEQGTTTAAIEKMTRMEQLELAWKYFRKRIKEFGPLMSLEDVYMAIHWPSAIGKPLSSTMYAKGSSAYAANAGLDVNKDHIITKAEAGALVRLKLAKGYQPQNVFLGVDN